MAEPVPERGRKKSQEEKNPVEKQPVEENHLEEPQNGTSNSKENSKKV